MGFIFKCGILHYSHFAVGLCDRFDDSTPLLAAQLVLKNGTTWGEGGAEYFPPTFFLFLQGKYHFHYTPGFFDLIW